MAKKCPPGVICIENVTILFLVAIVGFVIMYYQYINNNAAMIQSRNVRQPEKIIVKREFISPPPVYGRRQNVLSNPFTPPLRDGGYFPPSFPNQPGIPINIKTHGFNDHYRQVGLLTRLNGKETMLPLMGRPLHTNRNKWQFYTMSDKFNSLKLPVSRNGRSCTNEYGCDDLMNGDTVYVEGYNDAFKVTIYDNNQPRYIPFV